MFFRLYVFFKRLLGLFLVVTFIVMIVFNVFVLLELIVPEDLVSADVFYTYKSMDFLFLWTVLSQGGGSILFCCAFLSRGLVVMLKFTCIGWICLIQI